METPELDPLITELLRKMPKGDWPAGSRLRWLRTLAMNIGLVYDGDGGPVEFRIDLARRDEKQ